MKCGECACFICLRAVYIIKYFINYGAYNKYIYICGMLLFNVAN